MKNKFMQVIILQIFMVIAVMCASCEYQGKNENDFLGSQIENVSAANEQEGADKAADESDLEKKGNEDGGEQLAKENEQINIEKHAENNSPITRGLVAKMLSYAYCDKQTIMTMDREITFSDTSVDDWYDRYINATVLLGILSGGDGKFNPEGYLTVGQAQIILDRIDPNNPIKIKITDENKNTSISYALWVELYNNALTNTIDGSDFVKEFGIEEKEMIVMATIANNSKLSQWNIVTDIGAYNFTGFSLDAYIDKKIRVQLKGNEIISLLHIADETPTIANCYITNVSDTKVSVFSGGVERSYTYSGNVSASAGQIADVKIDNGKLVEITPYTQKLTGEIKRVYDVLELRESGAIEFMKDVKIYSVIGGTPSWKSKYDLTVGSSIAEFTIKDGKVCAAVISKKASPENIRVAITTSKSELLHDKVEITSAKDFVVSTISGEKTYKGGEILSLSSESDILPSTEIFERMYITPAKGEKLTILSTTRQSINPKYRGQIEVSYQDGGFAIVNELPLEEYLYAVVPSEMPTSHGLGAAKVQAITARSYAYNQFYANRYCRYGANVDDTVMCQVYNNVSENELSIQAADETKGMCLTYNGAVISANFFSTSGGTTANSGEVWASGELRTFPANSSAYLRAGKQYYDSDYGDLQIEVNADKFFKSNDIKSFDSGFSWFRWSVEMSAAEISASINANLSDRYNATKPLIKTLVSGNFLSRDTKTIGTVKDLTVNSRGVGGNILEMTIVGTEATIKVATELNIRYLIRPKQYTSGEPIALTRSDGSTISDFSTMPSAFFTFDKHIDSSGNLTGVTFYGGGYGHGVGMSQNGVKGMVDMGYNYKEILNHYYSGTEITKMY